MAISVPLTSKGKEYNHAAAAKAHAQILEKKIKVMPVGSRKHSDAIAELQRSEKEFADYDFKVRSPDDKYWAIIIAAFTSFLLVRGGFGFIEAFAAFLVGGFTLITIFNV